MRRRVVSRAQVIMRFDGPALSNHEIDVQELAPALLALGDVCVIANEVLNGSAARVQVLVRADIEQRCFQINIELVQSLYEQLTTFLDSKLVQDAKNIFEWLGLISGGAGGLFLLFKHLTKGEPEPNPRVEVRAEDGSVIYQIIGDGNTITIASEVHRLAQEPRMFPAFKRMVTPLLREGYDKLEFESGGQVTQYFTKEEARKIVGTPSEAILSKDGKYLESQIRTEVKIRKPCYEGNAKWGVQYKKAVDAKMVDQEWLDEFQTGRVPAPPGSSLIVDLEEKVPVDEAGEQNGDPIYIITKVHGVVPPLHQMRLDFKESP